MAPKSSISATQVAPVPSIYQDGRTFYAERGNFEWSAPFEVRDGDHFAAIEARALFHEWAFRENFQFTWA